MDYANRPHDILDHAAVATIGGSQVLITNLSQKNMLETKKMFQNGHIDSLPK